MTTMVRMLGLLTLLVLVPTRARAVIGGNDDVPAATLLAPYFEADPNGSDTKGVDTLLTVSNASATAILSHVTVWTDAAVPVVVFNIYLTGYDRSTFSMRDVLAGNYPRSASAGQDPQDQISPKGQFSQDINFASCTGQLPRPAADSDTVGSWRAAFSGKSSTLIGGCAGFDHGDAIMRGYVTVDTVNNCTLRKPGDVGYINGDLTDQNTQWGEYTMVDHDTGRLHTSRMVAIEASSSDAKVTTAGHYTFYGALDGWNATDHREPVGVQFGAPFDVTGGFGHPSSTTLIVWRDPKVKQGVFSCNAAPSWYPLSQEGVTAFDNQEHPEPLTPAATAFATATQKVVVDSGKLPVNTTNGWLYISLNETIAAAGNNPSVDAAAAQGWVDVLQDDPDSGAYGARGRIAVVNHATQIYNALDSLSSHYTPGH